MWVGGMSVGWRDECEVEGRVWGGWMSVGWRDECEVEG